MINYCSYEEKDQDQMYEVFYELTKEEVFFKELTKEEFKNRLFKSPAFKKEGTFVAKDEDNGDGTFDRYTDSKSWNSSLTFADFGNYNLSPVGNYYVQFESTRYSTGTVAAATLKNIYVTVYYH